MFLLAFVVVSLVALASCGGEDQEQESGEQDATGAAAEGDGGGRTEKTAGKGKGGGGRSEEVALEIGGDSGTGFSGACYVGDEEFEIGGQAPERYDYDLSGGGGLECGIRNEGDGSLEVVLAAGDTRSVQQFNSGTLNLSYADDSVSFSSSSGSTGGSGGQVVSSSVNSGSSTNSSSVVSSSSSTNSR